MKSFKVLFASLFTLLIISNASAVSFVGDYDGDGNSSCISLSSNLRFGDRDSSSNNVYLLQDFLNDRGYLSNNPTGFFGSATLSAVKRFQTANGLAATGYVGAYTREAIRSQSCGVIEEEVIPLPVITNPGQVCPAIYPLPYACGNATTYCPSIGGYVTPSQCTDNNAGEFRILAPSEGARYNDGDTVTVTWPSQYAVTYGYLSYPSIPGMVTCQAIGCNELVFPVPSQSANSLTFTARNVKNSNSPYVINLVGNIKNSSDSRSYNTSRNIYINSTANNTSGINITAPTENATLAPNTNIAINLSSQVYITKVSAEIDTGLRCITAPCNGATVSHTLFTGYEYTSAKTLYLAPSAFNGMNINNPTGKIFVEGTTFTGQAFQKSVSVKFAYTSNGNTTGTCLVYGDNLVRTADCKDPNTTQCPSGMYRQGATCFWANCPSGTTRRTSDFFCINNTSTTSSENASIISFAKGEALSDLSYNLTYTLTKRAKVKIELSCTNNGSEIFIRSSYNLNCSNNRSVIIDDKSYDFINLKFTRTNNSFSLPSVSVTLSLYDKTGQNVIDTRVLSYPLTVYNPNENSGTYGNSSSNGYSYGNTNGSYYYTY